MRPTPAAQENANRAAGSSHYAHPGAAENLKRCQFSVFGETKSQPSHHPVKRKRRNRRRLITRRVCEDGCGRRAESHVPTAWPRGPAPVGPREPKTHIRGDPHRSVYGSFAHGGRGGAAAPPRASSGPHAADQGPGRPTRPHAGSASAFAKRKPPRARGCALRDSVQTPLGKGKTTGAETGPRLLARSGGSAPLRSGLPGESAGPRDLSTRCCGGRTTPDVCRNP